MMKSVQLFCSVLIFCCVRQADSFIPDWSYGAISTPSSKWHTTITRNALDAVLQDYLRSSAICKTSGNIPPSSQKPWSPTQVFKACFGDSSSAARYTEARGQIMKGSGRPDHDDETKDNPLFHFDAELLDRTNDYLIKRRDAWFPTVTSKTYDFSEPRVELGKMFHTLQDFYSHTNWVEMYGGTSINPQIGLYSGVGGVAGPNDPTCSNCTKVVIVPGVLSFYKCENNLQTTLLTSGYYYGQKIGEQPVLKPTSGIKCSHGGILDHTADWSATGGINKDSNNIFLSPHYSFHETAASLARSATIHFMNYIQSRLDDLAFRRLLGIGGPALAFAIDTTGSMEPYINGAIERAKQIIDTFTSDQDIPDYYILSPFNDPSYGPAFVTDNADEFKAMLDTLTASGGGDIPEMCFHGIYLAQLPAEHGTPIFVFTDAPPKDYSMLNQLLALSQEKNLKISFELGGVGYERWSITDNLGRSIPSQKVGSSSNFDDYYTLASMTGGMVIGTTGSQIDIVKSSAIFDSMLRITTVTIFRRDTQVGNLSSVLIPVDNTMTAFSVTVTTISGRSCVHDILLTNPRSQLFDTSHSQLTQTAYMVQVNGSDLVMGKWSMNITTTPASCTYSVNVLGQSTAALFFDIAEFDRNSPHPSYQAIDGNPPAGQTLLLRVDASDPIVNFTMVDFIDPSNGSIFDTLMLEYSPDGAYRFFTNITIPNWPFRLQSSGIDSGNNMILRQIDSAVQPTIISLEASLNSDNGTYGLVQGGELNITLNITNHGPPDKFSFLATDSQNFIQSYDPKSASLRTGETLEAIVVLEANMTVRPGTVTVLQMIASTNTGSVNFVQMNIPVLAKDPDVWPPVCLILNSSYNDVCVGLDVMKTCDQYQWTSSMVFSDHGQGLYRATLKASGGFWNGSVDNFDLYLADKNVSAYVYGDCCVQNVSLTVVDVVGQSGQCFMQLIDTYPPVVVVQSSNFTEVCDKEPNDTPGCGQKQYQIRYSFLDYGLGLDKTMAILSGNPEINQTAIAYNQSYFVQYTARQNETATITGNCCSQNVTFQVSDMANLSSQISLVRQPGPSSGTSPLRALAFLLTCATLISVLPQFVG